MHNLGELERAIMDTLWSSDQALSANEVRDRLPSRDNATTTVLTVLSRLEKKGFVARDRGLRPHRYRAKLSRPEHTAALMHQVLSHEHDRDAALARFVGDVGDDGARELRRILTDLSKAQA